MSFSHFIKALLGLESKTLVPSDPVPPPQVSNEEGSDPELAHINQEMYKRSAELAERNKTLALLQKINGVILGSIMHLEEIAQQVASLVVSDGEFQLVSIFVNQKDKKTLMHIGCAQTNNNNADAPPITMHNYLKEIPFTDSENLIIKAVKEGSIKETDSIKKVLTYHDATENNMIRSVYVYPLVARTQLIGAMVVGLKEEKGGITDYVKDLMGRLAGVIGIALDNALLYAEVQANNERLKELDVLKNEFVSVASHELRTPMTAIKSYLWMALDGKGGPLSDKQKYYIDRAYISVDRLIKMVNDMLNISRIESGRLTINITAVNIKKLVQEVVDDVQPRAQEQGVHVTLDTAADPPPVLADPDKIKEVVFNLVGNSMKFTPKDGSVTVSFTVSDTMVEVKVKDTGAGLEPEDLPKLFQKFGLLPGSYVTNQAALGTGLGLYICKSIIELHEGKISASSQGRGKGAEFVFSLRIFNEIDLQRLSDKFVHDADKAVDLIHSQV